MGWRFRRQVNRGPVRFNFSKKGMGTTVGGRGFRIGKSADGRWYISVGIPGTGLYYQKYFGKKRK